MRVVQDIPTDAETMESALEGKITESRQQWRDNPSWKTLYETRIRYQRQPPPERFQSSAETRAKGHGDCDHFTVDRVAELRERYGEDDARPYIYQTGPSTWHAVVRRGDGTIEDPSKIQKARERRGWRTMAIGDDEGIPPAAEMKLRELANGKKVREIVWTTPEIRVTIEAKGDDAVQATERATAMARKVLSHPLVRQIAPPQVALALNAADKLVAFAKSGKVRAVAKRLKGPALKLARSLF